MYATTTDLFLSIWVDTSKAVVQGGCMTLIFSRPAHLIEMSDAVYTIRIDHAKSPLCVIQKPILSLDLNRRHKQMRDPSIPGSPASGAGAGVGDYGEYGGNGRGGIPGAYDNDNDVLLERVEQVESLADQTVRVAKDRSSTATATATAAGAGASAPWWKGKHFSVWG